MQAQTIHYIPPVSLTAKLRVAAYARVSSDSADQLESYAAQVSHYDQLIRRNPQWQLVDIYADEGLTGTRMDTREDFNRLLTDCRGGLIDKVLCKSISRFARNSRDCLTAVRELKSLGVSIYFEKERIDTGSMGSELMLSFHGAAAQEESLSISGNMRWSYQRRMKSGEFITQSAPFGYRLMNNHLVINEVEATVVRSIFEDYLLGKGQKEIAHNLNAAGILKQDSEWTVQAVYFVLNNEKYAGNALLQKSYMSNELPFRKLRNKGERDMFFVENSHPPIVSQATFDKAQALMRGRKVDATRSQYPFSLKILCGRCGATFKRRVTNGKAYWVCRSHDLDKHNCPVGRVPEAVLEQAFLRLHHKLRLHRHDILSPMLEQLETLQKRSALGQERVADIDKEILDIGRQSILLHRLHGAGHMEAAHYYEQTQGLNAQVNALRRERRHLLERCGSDESIWQTAQLLDILKDSPERLESFDSEFFHEMVQRMTISDVNHVRFTLTNGLEVTEAL